jgi:hypothetical protein
MLNFHCCDSHASFQGFISKTHPISSVSWTIAHSGRHSQTLTALTKHVFWFRDILGEKRILNRNQQVVSHNFSFSVESLWKSANSSCSFLVWYQFLPKKKKKTFLLIFIYTALKSEYLSLNSSVKVLMQLLYFSELCAPLPFVSAKVGKR